MSKNAIPNVFTFSNLGCGILSLIMTFQGDYLWACLFILLAGIMDRYDGRVARFLQVNSELGKELDSLADLVSFGVAPSILSFYLYSFSDLRLAGYILVLMFPIAGAYRLARFNNSNFDGVFMGIPITIAGMFLALYSLVVVLSNSRTPNLLVITIVLMISLSYLMVSNLKFKKV